MQEISCTYSCLKAGISLWPTEKRETDRTTNNWPEVFKVFSGENLKNSIGHAGELFLVQDSGIYFSLTRLLERKNFWNSGNTLDFIRFHIPPKLAKSRQIRIAPILILQSKYRCQLFDNLFFMNSCKCRDFDVILKKSANTGWVY